MTAIPAKLFQESHIVSVTFPEGVTSICADACFVQVNTLAVCANDVYGDVIRSALGSFGESAEMALRTFLGNTGLNLPMLLTGLFVVLISFILVQTGGLKTIGGFCEKMVPSMIVIYIVACIGVVVCNITNVLEVFVTIIICTLTALTIICSGVWSNGRTGVELTFDGFELVWGR